MPAPGCKPSRTSPVRDGDGRDGDARRHRLAHRQWVISGRRASPFRTPMPPSRCRYPSSRLVATAGASAPAPLALPSPMTTTAAPASGSALRAIAERSPLPGARDQRALTDGADDDGRLPDNPTTTVCDLPTATRARSAPRRARAHVVVDADDRQAALRNPDVALSIPLWVSPAHRCRSRAPSVNGADHDRLPHFRRILDRRQAGDEVPPRRPGRSIPERVRHPADSVASAP